MHLGRRSQTQCPSQMQDGLVELSFADQDPAQTKVRCKRVLLDPERSSEISLSFVKITVIAANNAKHQNGHVVVGLASVRFLQISSRQLRLVCPEEMLADQERQMSIGRIQHHCLFKIANPALEVSAQKQVRSRVNQPCKQVEVFAGKSLQGLAGAVIQPLTLVGLVIVLDY